MVTKATTALPPVSNVADSQSALHEGPFRFPIPTSLTTTIELGPLRHPMKERTLRASVHEEREATFFVPRTEIIRAIQLERLPVLEITQHNFPPELVRFLRSYALVLLAEGGNHAEHAKLEKLKCRTARVRKIESVDGVEYHLELKGKKQGPDGARPEVRIHINRDTYQRLLPQAKDGALRKRRYHLAGELHTEGDGSLPVTAEIDIITHAGKPEKRRSFNPPPLRKPASFALVDLEFSQADHAPLTEKHFHSFSFLGIHGVNLAKVKPPLRKALSARYLARHGIDENTRDVIRKLRKRSLHQTIERWSRKVA